jgi:hypothetical protein
MKPGGGDGDDEEEEEEEEEACPPFETVWMQTAYKTGVKYEYH